MQNEGTEIPQPEPVDQTTRSRHSLILGSIIGATAIIGSVFALSAVASANSNDTELVAAQAPASETVEISADEADAATSIMFDDNLEAEIVVPEQYQAHHDCINEIFTSSDFIDKTTDFEILEADPEAEAAFEACDELLPEQDRVLNAAFEEFEKCLDTELGVDKDAPDEAWDAISESDWNAADAACEQHLPPEVVEMEKAWEKFDQCLEDNGLVDDEVMFFDGEWEDFEEVPMVSVMDDDEFSIVEFGDGDGTVTITRSNGEFTVDATGDATVEELNFDDVMIIDGDFEEMEGEIFADELPAEFAECEQHLPADDFFGGFAGEAMFAETN